MQKFLLFLLILIIGFSCSKENTMRVTSNGLTESLLPTSISKFTYSSSSGDTINLYPISSSNYFEKSSEGLGNGGSLGNLDYIELERHELILGNDTLGFRFQFNLRTTYSQYFASGADDLLNVNFEDQNSNTEALLSFRHADTLRCLTNGCSFQDTLAINATNYLNVYYNSGTTANKHAIYLNSQNGLLKFVDRDSVIFELIP